jgi:catechol 2,3-dioxygenase-like lactoylglutathione lyase family enzyme
MIDHISLQVASFTKALDFYTAALKPLGYVPQYVDEKGKSAGFGPKDDVRLWIFEGKHPARTHLALKSPGRDAVGAFHAAALRAGGKDNGKPGLRPDYGATYYAAFVLDPDGNNLEAVTHEAK